MASLSPLIHILQSRKTICVLLLGNVNKDDVEKFDCVESLTIRGIFPNYEFASPPNSVPGIYNFLKWLVNLPFDIRRCIPRLKSITPDVVHINSGACIAMALAAHSLNIPVVWHIREIPRNNFITRFFYKPLLWRLSAHILCISNLVKDRVDIKNKRSQVIYNPAIKHSEEKITLSRKSFRSEHAIADDEIVILLLGNFSSAKGYLFFLDVVKKCKSKNLTFIIAGSPTDFCSGKLHSFFRKIYRSVFSNYVYPGKIYRLWSEHAKSDHSCRIILPGFVNSVEAISGSDLVVCPNIIPEPFGRTVIEAYSCKRPVLTSDIPAFTENVKHDVTGWRLPIIPSEWANFLSWISVNPEVLKKTGLNGYRTLSNYDPDNYALQILDIYNRILSQ